MDGPIRQRFAGDQQWLEQWIGASTGLGRPRGSSEAVPEESGAPPTDEVRPAA